MARWNAGTEIQNPQAYAEAIQRRIKANRAKTGRAKLLEALANEPELKDWLFSRGQIVIGYYVTNPDDVNDSILVKDQPAEADPYWSGSKYAPHPCGPVPTFLETAMDEWGGLTDGQLAFARKCFAERSAKAVEIAAKRAEEKANTPPWTAGRQTIEVTLLSYRIQDSDYGTTIKGLFKCDDGRKVWMTVPSVICPPEKGMRVRCSVKIEPKADDLGFAFGSRPTKVETL